MLTVTLLAAVPTAACTGPDPAWLAACEASLDEQRANDCKTACGADQMCPDATSQYACELECRACAPAEAWCPAE